MAGLRRAQAPAGDTPVTAGYNPGIRPRPARPQPTSEPRLAPTPTLTQTLVAAHRVRGRIEVRVAAVGAQILHPEAGERAGEAPRLGFTGFVAGGVLVGEDRRVELDRQVPPVFAAVRRVRKAQGRPVECRPKPDAR